MNATSKLVKAWESKNAKNAAKAGGISLMALSLAACGGSSITQAQLDAEAAKATAAAAAQAAAEAEAAAAAAAQAAAEADAATAAEAQAAAEAAQAAAEAAQAAADAAAVKQSLTTSDGETITGTAKDDTITAVISETASKSTLGSLDTVVDSSADDSDTLNITTDQDISVTPTIKGVETVNVTLDALSAGADVIDFDIALTNFSAGAAINIDSVKSGSIVSSVTITGDAGHTIKTSTDFTAVATTLAADADGTFDIDAVGNSVAPVTLGVSGAADTVTVDAAGYVSVTAAAVTDLVTITSVNDTTVSATAAAGIFVNAGGDVTLTDIDSATVVNITATGDVSAATTKMAAALAPVINAGGTVDVFTDDATSITVAGKKTITVEEDAGTTLVLANVTVAGEATTIDLDSAKGVVTVTVAGDQDYTLQMDAAGIDAAGDKVTLTDNTTAGSSTFKLVANAGAVDASKMTVDTIDLAVSNAAKTLTVASGQKVNISIDQAGATAIAGVAASASTNVVNVTFDDGVNSATNTAVDIGGDLDFTSFATVNLDMSGDSLANLAAETHVIDDMDSSGNVNITMGANNLSLTGVFGLGATNTLKITGTGTVSGGGSEAITVGTINAAGVSGVVTLSEIDTAETGSVTTGSGADVLTVVGSAGTEADIALSTGAGDDTITLEGGVGTARSVSIDGGEGDDTLVLSASAVHGATGAGETFTITNVEFLSYGDDTTIASEAITGQTFSLIAATSAQDTITVSLTSTDTSVDLSGLKASVAETAGVADETFVVDGSSLTGIVTITGTDVAKNTLTAGDTVGATVTGGALADAINGGAKADILIGGAGDDVFESGAGVDTLTGGAGSDEFNFAASDGGVTLATADIITDFTTGKDTLDIAGFVNGSATETIADASGAADWAAFVALADAALDGTDDDLYIAYDAIGSGNAYVVVDESGDGSFGSGDILIILTGIDSAAEIAVTDVV